MSAEAVPSPCILVCTLEADVCLGCGRTLGEIGEWSSASPARQRAIVAAAAARREARRPPPPVR
ncbi:DUF1289 domain-containing protein [Allosphingosinicella indica]|uniref:DUF1289 domain-containing protein n=1 Tax=Allosphingosinicella indica TaxID=941907 RepID=A0A1X7FZC0_9SPHN|nr:DUF1289 domain-containing protein [Allosphingosinicella indica]SMF61474.1 hypothetical protein SAMN06295910_0463 [Allosphingosinicella indica]